MLQALMIFQEFFNTPISGYLQSLITQLCNLLSFSGRFPDACKIAKLNGSQEQPSIFSPTTYIKIAWVE